MTKNVETFIAGDEVRVVNYAPSIPPRPGFDPNGREGVIVTDPDPLRQLAIALMGTVLVDLGPDMPTSSGHPHWIMAPSELERVA